jgi:hypothetical protein
LKLTSISRRHALATMALSPFAATASAARSESFLHIEIDGGDFESSTHLSEPQKAEIRRENYLRHYGAATYRFQVASEGWYVLWVDAAAWNTDLFVDDRFELHMPFASGVWRDRGALRRVVNLHFTAGSHTLGFSRPWHPGLPGVRRIVLERSLAPHEMARLVTEYQREAACFPGPSRSPLRWRARGSFRSRTPAVWRQTGNSSTSLWTRPRHVPLPAPAGANCSRPSIPAPGSLIIPPATRGSLRKVDSRIVNREQADGRETASRVPGSATG